MLHSGAVRPGDAGRRRFVWCAEPARGPDARSRRPARLTAATAQPSCWWTSRLSRPRDGSGTGKRPPRPSPRPPGWR